MTTNTTAATETKNAIIVSSYDYDHPFTDMNCAWSTVYTVFEIDSETIYTVTAGTGWGEKLTDVRPDLNIVQTTPDIIEKYKEAQLKVQHEHSMTLFEQYQKEIAEYNKSLRPQKKGQKVEILAGRRKGKIATISWIGYKEPYGFNVDKWYRKAYPMAAALIECFNNRPYVIPEKKSNLIRVWPEDGTQPFYIDINKVKVIEGFEPLTLTYEEVFKEDRRFNDDFWEKWHNGYNSWSIKTN